MCSSHVALCSDANKQRIGNADGAIEVIVAGMTAHAAAVTVQENACGALMSLAMLGKPLVPGV